jgi:hypothetical protein
MESVLSQAVIWVNNCLGKHLLLNIGNCVKFIRPLVLQIFWFHIIQERIDGKIIFLRICFQMLDRTLLEQLLHSKAVIFVHLRKVVSSNFFWTFMGPCSLNLAPRHHTNPFYLVENQACYLFHVQWETFDQNWCTLCGQHELMVLRKYFEIGFKDVSLLVIEARLLTVAFCIMVQACCHT